MCVCVRGYERVYTSGSFRLTISLQGFLMGYPPLPGVWPPRRFLVGFGQANADMCVYVSVCHLWDLTVSCT